MPKSTNTLRGKIRGYRRTKWLAAPPLIAVGLLGLALPVVPGLPFLALGVGLLVPSLKKTKTLTAEKS
jgi:hypothetical protein